MAEKGQKNKPKPQAAGKRALTPEARRALEEAEARRAAARKAEKDNPREVGGRDGPDPTRYGDWEKDGIVSDF